jgi:hypothetical protein
VSNLVLACHACNKRKGDQTASEFGHPEVEAQARQPLRDAAAMNATRYLRFVCSKTVKTGEEQQQGIRPADN